MFQQSSANYPPKFGFVPQGPFSNLRSFAPPPQGSLGPGGPYYSHHQYPPQHGFVPQAHFSGSYPFAPPSQDYQSAGGPYYSHLHHPPRHGFVPQAQFSSSRSFASPSQDYQDAGGLYYSQQQPGLVPASKSPSGSQKTFHSMDLTDENDDNIGENIFGHDELKILINRFSSDARDAVQNVLIEITKNFGVAAQANKTHQLVAFDETKVQLAKMAAKTIFKQFSFEKFDSPIISIELEPKESRKKAQPMKRMTTKRKVAEVAKAATKVGSKQAKQENYDAEHSMLDDGKLFLTFNNMYIQFKFH